MKYCTNSNKSRLFDGGEGVKIVAGENAAQLFSGVLKYHVYIFVLKRVQYTLRHKGLSFDSVYQHFHMLPEYAIIAASER